VRPSLLDPLFAETTCLPGVGPSVARLLEKLAGPRVADLCWHLPSGVIDRSYRPKIADAEPGRLATLAVEVEGHRPSGNRRQPYRIRCRDETGSIDLVFFHPKGDYLAKTFPVGARRLVSGKVESFGLALQMVHPDRVAEGTDGSGVAEREPVYPLLAGLAPRVVTKAVAAALRRLPELPEWQDRHLLARRGWRSWRESLQAAHAPHGEGDLSPEAPARLRLAYDELLASQLALALVRRQQRRVPGRALPGDDSLRRRLEAALPFALTGAQRRALAEIGGDMAAERRMVRLLQGDVGSGKTVVALFAMLAAVESGAQAALMAPTEILARQHHATLTGLLAPLGIEAALLTGREKGRTRSQILEGLADGRIGLVVGTHALFQDDVVFRDLGLTVIDEQHRFGVDQRLALAAKGRRPDLLAMTATPIPRTLLLVQYADMEVSRLDEKPAGRKPIETRVASTERLAEVVAAVGRALEAGGKVFWVCPLVEEKEESELAAAEARYRLLAKHFPGRVGLVHGRMRGEEKDRMTAAFADGPLDLLVATTVIEVGIDVPAANVMVIEQAERFGLAQLHQLRGRVGRGDRASTCLLLYQSPLSAVARERLQVIRDCDDGFRLAEEDLRLRGSGDTLGKKQSGMPAFRLAVLPEQAELLAVARDHVDLILTRNPELTGPEGEALRILLYLFERDAAVRTLGAG